MPKGQETVTFAFFKAYLTQIILISMRLCLQCANYCSVVTLLPSWGDWLLLLASQPRLTVL